MVIHVKKYPNDWVDVAIAIQLNDERPSIEAQVGKCGVDGIVLQIYHDIDGLGYGSCTNQL